MFLFLLSLLHRWSVQLLENKWPLRWRSQSDQSRMLNEQRGAAQHAKPALKVVVEAAHEHLLRDHAVDVRKPVATHIASHLLAMSLTNSNSTGTPKSM